MGFFNTLGNISQNKKNFKEWEKQDADKQAQREALYQKQQLPQEVLDKAKAKGRVIINTIDIMDTHSEEVAENTETAVMPFAGLAPLALSLIPGFPAYKNIERLAREKNEAIDNFLYKSNAGQELKDLVNELENKKIPGFKVWDYTSAFSKKNLQAVLNAKIEGFNSKDTYQALLKCKSQYNNIPELKNFQKGTKLGVLATVGTFIAAFIASNICAAKIQVKSSRIARWQSRQDLNDPRNFVQYTEEQMNTAKENLKKNGIEKEPKKGLGAISLFKKDKQEKGFFRSLGSTIADNKNYENWKKDYNLEDKKVQRELTPQELIEAQKDKEIIQRITKKINNSAEEYSENMETAAGVLINGTPILGGAVGALINLIVNKTSLGDKITNKNFEKILKNAPEADKEELKELFNKVQEGSKEKTKSFAGFINKATDQIKLFIKTFEASINKETIENSSGFSQFIQASKSLYSSSKVLKFTRGFGIIATGSMITGYIGAMLGLKLQKSSARAGRFAAKREIEQNPLNFVGYNEQDLDSVKDVKAKKTTIKEKFANYVTFLPRVIKEYFDYEKYKKTEAKEQKALLKELNKLEVTDKQLEEAKDLQRKLFTTFESVDDKSQEYSESMEAANEMVQPLIPVFGYALLALPFVIAGIKVAKKGTAGAIESTTGFLAKHTGFLKGRTVNKYFDDVSKNIVDVVAKQEVDDKALGILTSKLTPEELKSLIDKTKGADNEGKALLKELANANFTQSLKDDILTVFKSLVKDEKNINELQDNIMDPEAINKMIDNLDIPNVRISTILDLVIKNQQKGSFVESLNLKGLLSSLTDAAKNTSKKTPKDGNELKTFLLELIEKDGFVDKLQDSQLSDIINIVSNGINGKVKEQKTGFFANITNSIEKGINKTKIKTAIKTLAKSPDLPDIKISKQINDVVSSINQAKNADDEIAAILKAFKKTQTYEDGLNKFINNNIADEMTKEEIHALIINNFKGRLPDSILDSLLKQINSKANIKKAVDNIIDNYKTPINIKMIPKDGIKLESILNITTKDIENMKKAFLDKNKGLITNWTQEQIKNGSARKAISNMVGSMPDGATRKLLSTIAESNATDEQLAKIFTNICKCLKNIPTEQFKKILDTALAEFKKNPQKFMQALKSGSFAQVLLTKGLVTTTTLMSVGWGALSIALAFMVESTFASMQKKAGRLGVMKGLEELQDEKYYADTNPASKKEEVQNNSKEKIKTTPAVMSPALKNLLEKQQKTS